MTQHCDCCGKKLEKSEPRYVRDGQTLCRLCNDRKYPRCPSCHKALKTFPEDDEQCPHCHRAIYKDTRQRLFTSVLLNDEQLDAVETFRVTLAPMGITEKQFMYMSRQMSKRTGKKPYPDEVIQALEASMQMPSARRSDPSGQAAVRASLPQRPQKPKVRQKDNLRQIEKQNRAFTADPSEDVIAEITQAVSVEDLEAELEEIERRKSGLAPKKPDQDDTLKSGELPGMDKPKKPKYRNAQQELAHLGLEQLKPYGIQAKHFVSKEKDLRNKLKRQPTAAEVIKGLLPYAYARSEDFQKMAVTLIEMSRLFVAAREDPFTLQQYWARNHLLMLQEDGIEMVTIERGPEYCMHSRNFGDKEYSIDQAIIELPVPSPECDLMEKTNGKCMCRCDYVPVMEEEDLDGFSDDQRDKMSESFFGAMEDDDDFKSFLAEIQSADDSSLGIGELPR